MSTQQSFQRAVWKQGLFRGALSGREGGKAGTTCGFGVGVFAPGTDDTL